MYREDGEGRWCLGSNVKQELLSLSDDSVVCRLRRRTRRCRTTSSTSISLQVSFLLLRSTFPSKRSAVQHDKQFPLSTNTSIAQSHVGVCLCFSWTSPPLPRLLSVYDFLSRHHATQLAGKKTC